MGPPPHLCCSFNVRGQPTFTVPSLATDVLHADVLQSVHYTDVRQSVCATDVLQSVCDTHVLQSVGECVQPARYVPTRRQHPSQWQRVYQCVRYVRAADRSKAHN
jgi:hypothetical protein